MNNKTHVKFTNFDFLATVGVLSADAHVAAKQWLSSGAKIGVYQEADNTTLMFGRFQNPKNNFRESWELETLVEEADNALQNVIAVYKKGHPPQVLSDDLKYHKGLSELAALKPQIDEAKRKIAAEITLTKAEELGWTKSLLEIADHVLITQGFKPEKLDTLYAQPFRDVIKEIRRKRALEARSPET